jgi:hypothetical protein
MNHSAESMARREIEMRVPMSEEKIKVALRFTLYENVKWEVFLKGSKMIHHGAFLKTYLLSPYGTKRTI